MDTGDGRRLEIEADTPAAAEALTNSWAAQNPFTRSESSSMAGMLPPGAETAPTEVRSLPEQAAIIPQGIAGLGSGLGQSLTGVAELAPGQYGQAAARATQYLQGVGAPQMQVAGKIAGATLPAMAALRGVQGLGALGRMAVSATPVRVSNLPALARGAGTVVGGGIGGGAAGVATGYSTPTGIEDPTQRMAQKSAAALTEGGLGAGLGLGFTAAAQGLRAARGLSGSVEGYVGEKVRGVTPAQFDAAEQLSIQAREIGVPITANEAIQAATKGGSELGNLQRRLETSSGGAQLFSQFMADRPQLVQQAVEAGLNRISPAIQNPSLLEPKLRKIAEEIRADVDKLRTQATQPYYGQLEDVKVNPNAVKSLVEDIRVLSASKDETGRVIAPALKELESLLIKTPAQAEQLIPRQLAESGTFYIPAKRIPGKKEEYITDASTLDYVRQMLRDKVETPLYQAEGITKTQSSFLSSKLADLRTKLEKQVEPFRAGRQEYERLSRNIEKFESTPSGRLAEAQGRAGQEAVLFPEGRALQAGQENEIANLFQSISRRSAAQAPQALPLPGATQQGVQQNLAPQLIRQQLANIGGRTSGALTSAGLPNQYAGAALAGAIRRNPQYEKNLMAAMESSGVQTAPTQRLLDVLQATGFRQRPGSATASNTEEAQAISALGLGGIRQGLTSPGRTLSQAFAQQNKDEVTRRLSQIALSPDGVRTLQAMARNADMEGQVARDILRARDVAVPGLLGAEQQRR